MTIFAYGVLAIATVALVVGVASIVRDISREWKKHKVRDAHFRRWEAKVKTATAAKDYAEALRLIEIPNEDIIEGRF